MRDKLRWRKSQSSSRTGGGRGPSQLDELKGAFFERDMGTPLSQTGLGGSSLDLTSDPFLPSSPKASESGIKGRTAKERWADITGIATESTACLQELTTIMKSSSESLSLGLQALASSMSSMSQAFGKISSDMSELKELVKENNANKENIN